MSGGVPRSDAQAYDFARRAFAGCDPALMALRSGAAFDPDGGFFELDYLGRRFRVGFPGGEVRPVGEAVGVAGARAGGGARVGAPPGVDPATAALLLHYLCSPSGAAPEGRWVSFHELPGGAYHYGLFSAKAIGAAARAFAAEPRLLEAAAARLGGSPLGVGDASASIPALPLVTLGVVVWRGDDEVPPSANVIFDASAAGHLGTEDLEHVAYDCVGRLRGVVGREHDGRG